MLFPGHQTMGYVMSASRLFDDVNLSHMVKGVTASFPHHQVTIFPCVIK